VVVVARIAAIESVRALEGAMKRFLHQVLGAHTRDAQQVVPMPLHRAVQVAHMTRVQLRLGALRHAGIGSGHASKELGVVSGLGAVG
jgi:hypothetical protein